MFDRVLFQYPLAMHTVHPDSWCYAFFFHVSCSFTSLGHNEPKFVIFFSHSQLNVHILCQKKNQQYNSLLSLQPLQLVFQHILCEQYGLKNPIIFFCIYSPLFYLVYDGNNSFLLQLVHLTEHLVFNNVKYVTLHFALTYSQLSIATYYMIYSLRVQPQILLSHLGAFLPPAYAVL